MKAMEHDAVLTGIGDAVALDYAGDREGASVRLAALWNEIHPDGEALHRCMLAHYMADVQADPRQELLWDLWALDAAGSLNGGCLCRARTSMLRRSPWISPRGSHAGRADGLRAVFLLLACCYHPVYLFVGHYTSG
jgi:hypothetical protein